MDSLYKQLMFHLLHLAHWKDKQASEVETS